VVASLDPLRDPASDRRAHEAGHLSALAWYGYTADLVQLDLRHADFGGRFGHVEGIRRVTGDPKRESHDRAVIAAAGPLLAGVDLDHPSAITDSQCVDANWADGRPLPAWRFIVTERARDLTRHKPFAYTWRLLVVALGDLGERFVELRGDEVDAFISAVISPDAETSFYGTAAVPPSRPPRGVRSLCLR
jgi:hypothetical protein